MTEKRVGAYVGVDPTASSMHIGHILPFMVTFWMYLHGQTAISLVRDPPRPQGPYPLTW
jgi:tyrosyl-tRNA synthetase